MQMSQHASTLTRRGLRITSGASNLDRLHITIKTAKMQTGPRGVARESVFVECPRLRPRFPSGS